MVSGDEGRLLIYTHVPSGSMPAADLIELAASMQRQFPDHPVEPTDFEGLRQVTDQRSYDRADWRSDLSLTVVPVEIVTVVLTWLGLTVSKQVADQAIKAAADLIRDWMRSRRSKARDTTQVAYILGPDGNVLKEVRVRPAAPARQRTTRRRR
jgi:hypothetical protein